MKERKSNGIAAAIGNMVLMLDGDSIYNREKTNCKDTSDFDGSAMYPFPDFSGTDFFGL